MRRTAPVAASIAVELRHPPIVVAVAERAGRDEAAAVGRPVIFVDVAVGRRDRRAARRPTAGRIGDPLLVILLADLADLAHARLGRAGFLAGAEGDEQRDPPPVRREARALGNAVDRREGGCRRPCRATHQPRRPLLAGEEGEAAVGAEGEAGIVARRARDRSSRRRRRSRCAHDASVGADVESGAASLSTAAMRSPAGAIASAAYWRKVAGAAPSGSGGGEEGGGEQEAAERRMGAPWSGRRTGAR